MAGLAGEIYDDAVGVQQRAYWTAEITKYCP
jgi:hypothetical protein